MTGSGAIAAAAFGNELLALAAVLTAIALLVITRSFGHAELNLLTNRVRRFAGSLVRRPEGERPVLHHEQVQLHGKLKWEGLWATLTEFAELYELDGVDLMINLPSFGEEYHGTWRTRSSVEHHEAWRSDIPLVVDGVRAGHVRLIGNAVKVRSAIGWQPSLTDFDHSTTNWGRSFNRSVLLSQWNLFETPQCDCNCRNSRRTPRTDFLLSRGLQEVKPVQR